LNPKFGGEVTPALGFGDDVPGDEFPLWGVTGVITLTFDMIGVSFVKMTAGGTSGTNLALFW
jgi:hypothetical protein